MSNLQQSPYLREQRTFPPESMNLLTVEIDRTYIDIAQKVNNRTIGIFALNGPIVTGERWFLQGQPKPQQTLRQLYSFTAQGSYPHGINLSQIAGFTRIYGTIYDGTNWYPLPFVNATAANSQVSLVITPTNIVITEGGGASPTITQGFVVLEWLSQV